LRRSSIAFTLALLALVLTGSALAGNAGFGPEPAHSPNAGRINDAYWVVFGFTAAIFVAVEGALVFFILKYRSRDRTAEGDQVHGHTRLEVIWTVIPVVILAIIGTFIFYKLPGIKNAPPASAANRVDIRVDAHQFYWQFTYPDGQISINDVSIPVKQVAYFDLHAADVIHSFWVPQLGGKQDAIPGTVNHIWYQPDKPGTYLGRCAELCGLYHAKMPIRVHAVDEAAYRQFLAAAPAQLGRAEFEGACQLCHGDRGQGGYGPALANNPIADQPQAVATIVRNGRGKMPAVGRGWTDAQMKALTDYLQKTKGGSTGGG
jgi:cytochrome c oxidase subunit 2